MTKAVTTFVCAALVMLLVVGLVAGIDGFSGAVLFAIFAVGSLAIAVARKFGTGEAGPLECPDCGGVLSPNAPYCKHCGARL